MIFTGSRYQQVEFLAGTIDLNKTYNRTSKESQVTPYLECTGICYL